MWIPRIVSAVTAGAMLAGNAVAADYCFEAGMGKLFVVKSFKRPAPAKCRALAGYEASTTIPQPASGTACLSASGAKLYLSWSLLADSGGFTPSEFHSRTELPYPSLTGGETTYHFRSPTQDFWGNTTASGFRCDPAPLP